MGKQDDSSTARRAAASDEGGAVRRQGGDKPVYEKPRLRRYDQIDQVKPYGPSEL